MFPASPVGCFGAAVGERAKRLGKFHLRLRRHRALRPGRHRRYKVTDERWITHQELADRYGVPVKTPAEWASKGTGPPYVKFGRHVRYRLRDVRAWETKQLVEHNRDSA